MKAHTIAKNGRRIKENGCWWFKGCALADGSHEEFAEDCTHLITDLASQLSSPTILSHTYNFTHINHITDHLGVPWEPSMDTPFSSIPVYIGFVWDLENKTVSLIPAKQLKYSNVILKWLGVSAHILEQVQKLHRQLSHASLVIPEDSVMWVA